MHYRREKIAILFFSFWLIPSAVFAACTEQGTTVTYVNGVSTTLAKAKADLIDLRDKYNKYTGDSSVNFINTYNASHLEGAGDLLKTWFQNKSTSSTYVDDYDLKTILINLHSDLTTRRVLLVGHSQGSYYTNAMYNYLLSHGQPREATAIYNVATPASFVEGGGNYLNSSGDTLLMWVKSMGFNPLPNNIDLVASVHNDAYPGHSFSKEYLANAPERVVGDIQSQLQELEPAMASETGECFTAPEQNLAYKTAGVALGVGDTFAFAGKKGVEVGHAGAKLAAAAIGNAVDSTKKVIADIGITIGGIKGLGSAADGSVKSRTTNFDIFKHLYGSSLDKKDIEELLGSAVATAPMVAAKTPPMPDGIVAGVHIEVPEPPRKYVSTGRSRGGDVDVEPDPLPEIVEDATSDTTASTTPPEPEVVVPVATSTEETATTTPILTGGSPVEDSFDSFDPQNTSWGQFGSSPRSFEFTNDGCVEGGCIVGSSTNRFTAPRIYKESGDGQLSGAFTVYAKAKPGAPSAPDPVIGLCTVSDIGCSDGARADIIGILSDDTWHHYLVVWRQGTTKLETCLLQDSLDVEACTWVESEFDTETAIDGVAFWSALGFTSEHGGNLWFDELEGYAL